MVESEYQSRKQEVLSWRQAAGASEEAGLGAAGIVIAVFQAEDRAGLAIRDAIFECGRDGFYGLPGCCPAAIAIPEKLGAHGCAPALVQGPVHRQLASHHQGAGTSMSCDLFP